MKPKTKTLIIASLTLILLAGTLTIAQPNFSKITPGKAKNLKFDKKVKLSEIVPCKNHPVFNVTPACKKVPNKPVRGPPQGNFGKGPNQNAKTVGPITPNKPVRGPPQGNPGKGSNQNAKTVDWIRKNKTTGIKSINP
ncbi:MAG: hypothetical protein ABEI74_04715 [Candidatus Pacearchaeota archaeon]